VRLAPFAGGFQRFEVLAIPRPVACPFHRRQVIERTDLHLQPVLGKRPVGVFAQLAAARVTLPRRYS
jgi:hypothetical protein